MIIYIDNELERKKSSKVDVVCLWQEITSQGKVISQEIYHETDMVALKWQKIIRLTLFFLAVIDNYIMTQMYNFKVTYASLINADSTNKMYGGMEIIA